VYLVHGYLLVILDIYIYIYIYIYISNLWLWFMLDDAYAIVNVKES
jgi:hypothetical protein